MPPRPDSQSFTKFVISAGVFLLIAAFVLPGLILRDTGVLEISQRDLESLTPAAAGEIERRQATAGDAGRATPYIFGFFLVGGAALVAFGLPRLKQQEKTAEEREAMERDKLRGELRPQTAQEKAQRLQAEVEEEKAEASDAATASRVTLPRSLSAQGKTRSFSKHPPLRDRAMAEVEILAHLKQIAPPLYEVQSHVKLEGPPSLLLDALLLSQIDQLPDIIVEIKFAGENLAKNFRNRVADAESQLLRYLTRYRRDSQGWLIFFVTEELPARRKDEIEARAADLADIMHISLVTADTLDSLTLPVVV